MTTYIYRWRVYRPELFGQRCTLIARGKMNSAWVRFEDGTHHIISRNALRKAGGTVRTKHLLINDWPVTVIDLTAEPRECRMCGAIGFHEHFVWYYEEPCCSLHPERGGMTTCKRCHDRWAAWDDLAVMVAECRGIEAIRHLRFPG